MPQIPLSNYYKKILLAYFFTKEIHVGNFQFTK